MKNTRFNRALALILAVVSVLALLGGCKPKDPGNPGGPGNVGGDTVAGKAKPKNVWRETSLPIPETLTSAYQLKILGNKVLFPGNDWDWETNVSSTYVNSYDIVTGEMETLLFVTNPPSDYERQIYEYRGFSHVTPMADGTFWLIEENTRDDYSDPEMPVNENNTALKHFDAQGNELAAILTKDIFPNTQYIWINRLEADAQGNLYVLCDMQVAVIDSGTGVTLFTLTEDNYIQTLLRFGDGTVAISTYASDSSGQVLKPISVATKSWGATTPVPSNTYFDITMPGDGTDYLFYYLKYDTGLFGLKADGTPEEILNFLNSDISADSINGLLPLDGGDLLMVWYDYDYDGSTSGGTVSSSGLRFSRLTRVPDDEVKEATLLTYACMWLDYDLKRKIMRFNKENGEYRIVIDDYSRFQSDSDWEAGYKRLAADIIMGKVPDIINLDQINTQTFINKGLLADLYELIDESPNHKREDYVQSVLKASESNGKLYSFTPRFSIYTVAAKRSIVGDTPGWTMDDLNALMARFPAGTEAFAMMTKSEILSYSLMLGLGQYVDWEKGTVDFGEGFIKLLEFANTFPKEIDYDKIYGDGYDWEWMSNRYREDRVLLSVEYMGGARDIRYIAENNFGEDVTLIGFPTEDRSGSVFMHSQQYAISAKIPKDVQQVCFEFLSSLVETEPNFEQSNGYFYGSFSINQSYNDKVLAYELLPMRERPGYVPNDFDYDKPVGRDTPAVELPMPEFPGEGGYDPNAYEATYPLSQYEVDAINNLIRNTTKYYVYDTNLMNIITEETDAYFAGQKSAAEAAKQIQSRAAIYVSEQS